MKHLTTRCSALLCFAGLLTIGEIPAQSPPPLLPPPPSPPGLKAPAIRSTPPLPGAVAPGQVPRRTNVFPIAPPPVPLRAFPPAPFPVATVNSTNLAWEAAIKEYSAKEGETSAHFTFGVTNVSKETVLIRTIRTSCGCTVAKLPTLPWKLEPGNSVGIDVVVDLRGKRGLVTKLVTVDTSAGVKFLTVQINIPEGMRSKNLLVAMADRQAVFKGNCATCHLTPALGKSGEALYQTACGICHDSSNRASMVPDLRAGPKGRDEVYWASMIRNGKPGSLMPAFAQTAQGPLTDEQIAELASFLNAKFSSLGLTVPGQAVQAQ